MTLPRRALGGTGLTASVLSLGSWHTWDRMTPEAAANALRQAVAAGINLFDVGWYDFGPHVEGTDSDVRFGEAVRAAGLARADYLLAEKVWLWTWPAQSLIDQLRRALDRVGVDRADLVVLGDYVGKLDLPRVVTEAAGLVSAGLTRGWAVNNWAADDLAAAHAFATREQLPVPVFAQLKYNVCRRSIAEGSPYRRLFTELGIGLQASDVLEGGILAGRGEPARRIGADPGGIREGIRAAAAQVVSAAADFGATPAQVALAFVLTHPATSSALVGISRPDQLADNLGAIDLATRHGTALRERLADLWLDRHVVAPTASWGARRDDVPPVPPAA